MKSVYTECPEFENQNFRLRKVNFFDSEALLKVYSDEAAVPFFNSDNCEGDTFHYQTLERMNRQIAIWEFSYNQKSYVRWTIDDLKSGKPIGTIELFHRDSIDAFTNCGLLRLDLRSDFENSDVIKEILQLILKPTFSLFKCDKIATKCISKATERKSALEALGFVASSEKLIGNDGTKYSDYYILKK